MSTDFDQDKIKKCKNTGVNNFPIHNARACLCVYYTHIYIHSQLYEYDYRLLMDKKHIFGDVTLQQYTRAVSRLQFNEP